MARTVVYSIKDFGRSSAASVFYAQRLSIHVKEHQFTNLPHKHDFYLLILVTKGSGRHEIDFVEYPVEPGSVFLMQPGQMHSWQLSKDIEGFVFFHSKEFYEEAFTHAAIHRFNFFSSVQSVPYVKIGRKEVIALTPLFTDMLEEYKLALPYKFDKLHALVNLVYIAIARVYGANEPARSSRYLDLFNKFEELVERDFRSQKLPKYYASKLNITEKHLNRICRECVNKTSTRLIADRVLLEAKRLLMQSKQNITETGYAIGFNDTSYFVRFFKKYAGETPLSFQKKYFK